jgi:hypothetical protein
VITTILFYSASRTLILWIFPNSSIIPLSSLSRYHLQLQWHMHRCNIRTNNALHPVITRNQRVIRKNQRHWPSGQPGTLVLMPFQSCKLRIEAWRLVCKSWPTRLPCSHTIYAHVRNLTKSIFFFRIQYRRTVWKSLKDLDISRIATPDHEPISEGWPRTRTT